jgi:hypothetical protein
LLDAGAKHEAQYLQRDSKLTTIIREQRDFIERHRYEVDQATGNQLIRTP